MAAGAGELHAWAVHGAAAAERARRVMTAVHLARERAQRALADTNARAGGGSAGVSASWSSGLPQNTLHAQVQSQDSAHGALLEARAQLAAHRAAAREKLACIEAEARAEEVRKAAARAEAARAEATAAERAAAQAAREKSAEEARMRALEAEQARERAKQADEARRKHEAEQKRLRALEDEKQTTLQRTQTYARTEDEAPKITMNTSPTNVDNIPEDARKARTALLNFESRGKLYSENTNPDVKRERQRIKRGIVKACNQISASKSQVRRCANLLYSTIMDAAALGSEQGAWAFALAARRLVEAGEDVGGPMARFAWAYTAAGVVIKLPSFGQVLYGALIDAAPAVSTLPTPRLKNENNDAYRERVRARNGEGADAYADRSAKTISLFAALCQTCNGKGDIGVHMLWAWLARVVNAKPHFMAPICVVAMLENAGHALTKAYFKQFAKLMATVQQRIFKNPSKNSPPGPLVNLEQLIANFIQGPHNFQFHNPPNGLLLPEIDQQNF